MVPEVNVSSPVATPIIERLDRSDTMKPDPTSDSDTISSMPVYQGSIVRIEQHMDDRNLSDLIIRVPNFQHCSSPTTDTTSKSSGRIKRRAPLCPALYGPDPNLSITNNTQDLDQINPNETRMIAARRLTTGLRSLSRAFTYGCISKRTTSISEITTPPSALPDVEVMNEKLQVVTAAIKTTKHSTPKLIPPKILSVKRKHSKIKRQPVESNKIQTDQEINRLTSTPTPTIATTSYAEVVRPPTPKVTSFLHRFVDEDPVTQEIPNKEENGDDDDNDREQQNESIRLSFDGRTENVDRLFFLKIFVFVLFVVEQHFNAISQLIADLRMSPTDGESLSTHRYSTISTNIPDIQISPMDYEREDLSSPELPSVGISHEFNPRPSSLSPKIDRPFRVQTSILQPDISVIRVGTINFTIPIDQRLPGEQDFVELPSNIEQEEKEEIESENNRYEVISTNAETLAECYEVTYQIDSEQSLIVSPSKIIIDPFEYKNLASSIPTNETLVSRNDYESIGLAKDTDENVVPVEAQDPARETTLHVIENKSRSVDDVSRTSDDQTSSKYQIYILSFIDHRSLY